MSSRTRIAALALTALALLAWFVQPLNVAAVAVDTNGATIQGRVANNGLGRAGWVRVEVWPNDAYLHSLPDGTRYEKYPLGPVMTDRSGRFTFTVPTTLPAEYVGDDGEIAIEMTGTDGVNATIANLSVALVDTTTQQAIGTQAAVARANPSAVRAVEMESLGSRPTKDLASPTITLDVGTRQAADKRKAALADARAQGLDDTDAAATPIVAPAADLGMAVPSPAVPAAATNTFLAPATPQISAATPSSVYDYWDCWQETGKRHGPYPEKFATFYGKSYAKGRVVHNDGTSHTVGVGVQPPHGQWGQARTDSVKATGVGYDSSYTIADANVYDDIYQRYHYAKCKSQTTGEVETTTTTKPDGFADGPQYSYAPHVDYGTCSATYAEHTYSRTSYTNGTYSAGLDLPFINLSAQSGWTSTTEMHWKFTKAGKLCGSGGLQWGKSKRVSAK